MKLKRDVRANLWGVEVTIPKGTALVEVKGHGGGFAVASINLLQELTGNKHDPKYRYVWVNFADIE